MDQRETSPKNIFIVDDEEPIRKVLRTHLSKAGYSVVESTGGQNVFDEIDASPFDVLISDIKMPHVEGPAVLEFVRSKYDTRPVIMLTGLTDISLAINVMKKGAFDYIMKPVKKDELLGTIEKAVTHGELLVRNKDLERQNREYQLYLEDMVKARTDELNRKAQELDAANHLLKNMNIEFVTVMAETIEAKDRYTRGHCDRMREKSRQLGELLQLSDTEMETLEYATILHDLGKVGVSENILNKPGPLTAEERKLMLQHAMLGEKILEGISLMGPAAKIVGSHHENFDGTGYPRGLKEEDIPLAARVISVLDMFDAMYSDRPYRKGMPIESILEELRRVAGTQLDPTIVELFIRHKLYE
jgi:putative two-component system response regulator